jgi:hypothetical protein
VKQEANSPGHGTASPAYQPLIIAAFYVENLLSDGKAESLTQNDE